MIHDVMLEMGGKDPAIVLNDADLEQAANAIIKGAFTYAGQRCTAIKRVIVLDEVANDLVTLLQAKITQLSVGIPKTITDDFMVTPLINEAAALFADTLINDALQAGAHIASQNGYKRDLNLVFPTLLDNVAINSRIALEEQFAPILPIIRVKTIDEAIEIANGTIYGLQTSLFTKDINGAFKIADKLHAGTVNINAESQRSPDHFPFLGIKSSSFGGSQSIKDFLLASVIKKGIILNIKT